MSSCSRVVTLHGSVSSDHERDEIGKIATSVVGVEGVLNRLRVA